MKKLLLLVVIVAVLGAGYYFLVMRDVQHYVNDELGYSVTLPDGWVATGPNPADVSRTVYFAPEGTDEDQLQVFFSVSVDERTLSAIKKVMPASITEVATVVNGSPASLFTLVTPHTEQILVEHGGKTFWLGPYDSENTGVQDMIASFRFTK